MSQSHQDKTTEQRHREQAKEYVRKACTELNTELQDITSEQRDSLSKVAEAYACAIIGNPFIMQTLIIAEMSNNPPQLLTPDSGAALPTMGNLQEALMSTVDLGYRLALQHKVLKNDTHKMSFNHCRFRVPVPAELEQPKN